MAASSEAPGAEVRLMRSMDLRYVGQSYELRIPVPDGTVCQEHLACIADRFHAEHARSYGFAATDEPIELVNIRLTAIGAVAKPRPARGGEVRLPQGRTPKMAGKGACGKLGSITPAKVQEWKRSFLSLAGSNAISLRRARVSVNSLIRQAKCLFSPKITRHLELELPDPPAFHGIEFEPRPSLKYRSRFDVRKVIQTAIKELSETQPELFKIFLLAVMVGLRRKEIDLLEWESFLWDADVIRIEETKYFHPKSQDSVGDVPVDAEVMEIFRGYRARSKGPFVILPRLGKDGGSTPKLRRVL